MDTKPLSVMHTLAEHFHRDAIDFVSRFDLLWEAGPLMHKMGRTKTFIDLLMGCECALKCHGFLSHLTEQPRDVYRRIRSFGHNIANLADYATFLQDRTYYNHLKNRLATFPVFLRYSLDAYETFFPSFLDRSNAELNYSQTIGNNAWVLEIREALEGLNTSVTDQLSGFVTTDLEALFAHEKQMREFAESCL